jgi:hypothetical protein
VVPLARERLPSHAIVSIAQGLDEDGSRVSGSRADLAKRRDRGPAQKHDV